MTETPSEILASIVSAAEEALFEKFDRLHSKGIHDDKVINFLRDEGHYLLANRYIEWSGALDPNRESNSTLSDVVPDPSDVPSYKALGEALNRNALNAFLRRSDFDPLAGVREDALQFLRKRIPVGTRVAYWPGPLAGPFTEAVTSSEVRVKAGIAVVDLASGREVDVRQLQVIS
ncbi:hypothetical protein PBI_BEAGLE_71 [Arthrobacter phage Beagle]|nr:hypothetical protein PBI_BEAGLE_71 [Arthrobacter phage Beagle]